MGVKISDVPYLGTIIIAPGQDSKAMIDDGDSVSYHDRQHLVDMVSALNAAIAELDKQTGASNISEPTSALFRVGQVLEGGELLPIGTVVQDGSKDWWTLRPNGGWTCTGADEGRWTLEQIIESYGPATIVSLP